MTLSKVLFKIITV